MSNVPVRLAMLLPFQVNYRAIFLMCLEHFPSLSSIFLLYTRSERVVRRLGLGIYSRFLCWALNKPYSIVQIIHVECPARGGDHLWTQLQQDDLGARAFGAFIPG